MPKITIKEIDMTNTFVASDLNRVVVVPGLVGEFKLKPDEEAPAYEAGTPTLCRTVREFQNVFGVKPYTFKAIPASKEPEQQKAVPASYDKGWIVANSLLKLGMQVLYIGFNKGDTEIFEGETLTESEFEKFLQDYNFSALEDRSIYDFRFLTLGGYNTIGDGSTYSTIASDSSNIVGVAKARKDCVALVDCKSTSVTYDKVLGEFNNPGANNVYTAMSPNWEETFVAAFAPWCTFNLSEFGLAPISSGEEPNATEVATIDLPGSIVYLFAFAQSIQNYPTWYAAAGSVRGVSPYAYAPTQIYGELAVNTLETRDPGTATINAICNVNPYGYLMWGNRTLCPVGMTNSGEDTGEDLSASNFLNIRNLIIDIKKTLYQACRSLTFEQNNDTLWTKFTAAITPLLDTMKTSNGISGYKLTKGTPTRKAEMVATLRIVPIEAVEDFTITIEIGDSLEVTE